MNPAPDPAEIKKHLEKIAVARDAFENPGGLQTVQTYLREKFQSWGYTVTADPFVFQGRSFDNLIARKSFNPAEARLILGAHFDAVPATPGADDNASGTACLLEAARCLAEETACLPFLEFAAFNLEEYGMLGSAHYAQALRRQGVALRGMLSLEMVGYTSKAKDSQQMPLILKPFYPSTGDFLALVGDTASGTLLKQAEKAFKRVPGLPVQTLKLPAKGRIFPETRLSDHSPFWDADYPALLVTDTSFFRNPHYHRASDTLETLDPVFMEKVTRGIIELVRLFIP